LPDKEPHQDLTEQSGISIVFKIGKEGRLKKQQRILKYPKVLKWFKTLRLSSPYTAENYLRRLDYLCYNSVAVRST